VLIAGSVVVIETALATHMSWAKAMAISALTVFALAAVVTALGRERHRVEFGGGRDHA
jgi:hypothetical protein